MDPISAASFAATILTFIDFSFNLVKGSYDIYQSATGASADNIQISTILVDLQDVTAALQSDVKTDSPHQAALKKLAGDCTVVSDELSGILESLKRKEGNRVWRSIEAKWKSVLKEKKVASIELRLDSYRAELLLRLNLIMSERQLAIKTQLDEIEERGLRVSPESLKELQDVQQTMDRLAEKLTNSASENLQNRDAHRGISLSEIRTDLSTILSRLELIPNMSSVETSVLKRLQFNSMYSRVEAIDDTGFGTFEWLLQAEPEKTADEEQRETESSETGEDVVPGATKLGPSLEAEDGIEPPPEASDRISRPLEPQDGNSPPEKGDENQRRISESKATETAESEEVVLRREVRCAFLEWLKTEHGIYHISGKAGSGKSTLMKFLSQNLHLKDALVEWAGTKTLVFASFFFWNSGDSQQKSLEGLYRSLLFEILSQCPDLIGAAFPGPWTKFGADLSQWDNVPFRFSELKYAMNLVVKKQVFPRHRFCFFIDGLDEFQANLLTDHWDLAHSLERWAVSPDIKICVSSRPHEEFLQTFNPKLRLYLHELTKGDIRRFVYGTFRKEPNYDEGDKDFSRIVSDVVERSDGVFLWVRLVVRMLIDGIRHRFSSTMLTQRLEKLPRSLEPLFDQLFSSIDPSDREKSDMVLLLTASKGAFNALQLSWLDDLEDPEFPFNAQPRPYSDDEVRSRLEVVRAQLDSLSKGLLEMTHADDLGMKRVDDIYFGTNVGFFHATVREYLNHPKRLDTMKKRLGPQFNVSHTLQRLRLAEFKFVRTRKRYFEMQGLRQTALISSMYDMINDEATYPPMPGLLGEYERMLEHHRKMPFSHPEEKAHNSGSINWSQWRDTISHLGTLSDTDFSFLHLIVTRYHQYVLERVLSDTDLLKPRNGLSLLFCASSSPGLTRDLIKAGADINEQITVRYKKGGILRGNWSQHTSESTTVLTAFLFILAQDLFEENSRSLMTSPDKFLVLEEFVKARPNLDAHFLLQHKKQSKIEDEAEAKVTAAKQETENGAQDSDDINHAEKSLDLETFEQSDDGLQNDDEDETINIEELVLVTLGDIILAHRPSNLETLLKLLPEDRSKRNGKGVWTSMWHSMTTVLIPRGSDMGQGDMQHRRVQVGELHSMKKKYNIKMVSVNGQQLRRGFAVGMF